MSGEYELLLRKEEETEMVNWESACSYSERVQAHASGKQIDTPREVQEAYNLQREGRLFSSTASTVESSDFQGLMTLWPEGRIQAKAADTRLAQNNPTPVWSFAFARPRRRERVPNETEMRVRARKRAGCVDRGIEATF